MTAIVTTAFHEPVPQAALGGELGLTSFDIAESLGIRDDRGYVHQTAVRQRIDRNLEFLRANHFSVGTEKRAGTGGRAQENYVLSVEAAKYIVATWKSDVGVGYFRYLLACEQKVERGVPQLEAMMLKLKEDFNRLADDNARLRTENQAIAKALPKAKVKREKRYRVPVIYGNMFGDGLQVRYELRTQKECKEWQWAVGMLPMLVHLRQTLGEKIDISKREVVDYVMANLSKVEFGGSREEVEAALAKFTSEDELGKVCN